MSRKENGKSKSEVYKQLKNVIENGKGQKIKLDREFNHDFFPP